MPENKNNRRQMTDQELERDAGQRHQAALDTIRESGDQALEELFESNVLHMVERKARDLENIEAALIRIDSGKYGQCADCGRWIRPARLEVMPDSVRCRRCQEQYEKIRNLYPAFCRSRDYLLCPQRHCRMWPTNSSSQNTSSPARCLRTCLEQENPQM